MEIWWILKCYFIQSQQMSGQNSRKTSENKIGRRIAESVAIGTNNIKL